MLDPDSIATVFAVTSPAGTTEPSTFCPTWPAACPPAMAETTDSHVILSLGAGGRVREFQLRYRVQYRLTDEKNREHIPMTEIVLKRDYSFNDEQALSKESEEALLYRDMRNDAVQQLVRRLQAAKLQS